MHKLDVSEHLKKVLARLCKKEPYRYEMVMKKVDEILRCDDVDHYKNLRAPLQRFKRVHIDTHFVLTFRYNTTDDTVTFYDFDHHDSIYKKDGT